MKSCFSPLRCNTARKRCKFVPLVLLPPLRNRSSTSLSSPSCPHGRYLSGTVPPLTRLVLSMLRPFGSRRHLSDLSPFPGNPRLSFQRSTFKSPHPDLNVCIRLCAPCASLYVVVGIRQAEGHYLHRLAPAEVRLVNENLVHERVLAGGFGCQT